MKSNYKKIITVLVLIVLVLGIGIVVSLNKHLGKLTSDEIVVDVTETFDVNAYLTNLKKGVEVSYELDEENSHLTVNLTNGKKNEVLEKDVTIKYPRVIIPDDISIDTFTGYDINDIVDYEDGVNVSSNLNLEDSELTINYSKGEYSQTVVKKVTLFSSNPRDNARFYDCVNIVGTEYGMIVYPDGTLEEEEMSGNVYNGEWKMEDENNGEMFHMINAPSWWTFGIYFSDDSSEASFFIGNDLRGGAKKDVCKLTKIEPFTEDMKILD